MSDLIVNIEEGKIRGTTGKNYEGKTIYEFLGIPYAEPPLNELRFKPPVPIKPWDGIKDTIQSGSPCISRDDITREIVGCEDCLFINVYTRNLPNEKTELKPVMVYIHGGGLVLGSARRDLYGPEFLLLEDIVLVTLNYRLGILGFLGIDDPSLEATGNAGFKDQCLALKWVQRNIKYFNGDANNVTLFGESAGSGSVHAHVLSPMSKGLFHRAIMQSGSCLNSWFWGTKNNGREIVKAMGKEADSEEEALKILKTADMMDIFQAQQDIRDTLFPNTRRPFSAVIETPNPDAFFTETPVEILRKGTYNNVPLIIGYTDKEGMIYDLDALIYEQLGMEMAPFALKNIIPYELNVPEGDVKDIISQLEKIYPADPSSRHHDELTDSCFLMGILNSLLYHLKTTKHPIYFYRVSACTELNYLKRVMKKIQEPGCCHADELGYLFHSEITPSIKPNSLEEKSMRNFVTLWTNFAKFGHPAPSDRSEVIWNPVEDAENLKLLNIDEELIFRDIPEQERLRTWMTILEKWPIARYN